jgi:4-hydroxy-2-oxoglutarate aldolase
MELTGVMPPIATPFLNGEVAETKLEDNLRKWNKTDLSGYVVLGSNGENVYLSEKEKIRVLEVARRVIPRDKVMIAGTGMESTRETIHFTNQAAACGADLALVVTPCYYKGSMKPQILHDHFVAVAEAARIPILIYNVPQNTGVNMEPDLVARLSGHPNIAGIKDSSGTIGQLTEIIHLSRKSFAVLVGSAPVFFPALCVGATGGILAVANVTPEICTRIYDLYRKKNFDEALALQNKMTPLAKAVTVTYGIAGLKVAMDLGGYFGGEPRAPLRRPGGDVKEALEKLLSRLSEGSLREKG